jgi:hypothetical protein
MTDQLVSVMGSTAFEGREMYIYSFWAFGAAALETWWFSVTLPRYEEGVPKAAASTAFLTAC